MRYKKTESLALFFIVLLLLFMHSAYSGESNQARRSEKILSGPNGIRAYTLDTGKKGLSKSYRPPPWSILNSDSKDDTVNIIALMAEFQLDSSNATTGNGHFGIRKEPIGTYADKEEMRYYQNGTYKYDNLPHDRRYFENQLEFAKRYYSDVSKGNLHIRYRVFPDNNGEPCELPQKMTSYSPGEKYDDEAWSEYYLRRTKGLLRFVRDAVKAADSKGWLSDLKIDSTSEPGRPFIIDSTGTRTGILIFHAGASYLTDGGYQGNYGQDTPSDMLDAFVSREYLSHYGNPEHAPDTVSGIVEASGTYGIPTPETPDLKYIPEIMLVSETSNQDSLNWGIHGILINQIGRFLGIPDLYATTSGISGIGSFGIMDFAGYSAGRGFIPPLPSAWTRLFMGWEEAVKANPENTAKDFRVYAADTDADTTLLMVPLNQSEYYLIENRQRNLSGSEEVFNYDSLDRIDETDPFNMDSVVLSTDSVSNTILDVASYDISLPGSGVLVWHIDEKIIKEHLEYNMVNADSLFRGISLVEADGVTDLGVMFRDFFYQAVFDYGQSSDIFPHIISEHPQDTINYIGPFSRPSTISNDGGQTYTEIRISPGTGDHTLQKYPYAHGDPDDEIEVTNFCDSVFTVSVGIMTENISMPQGWPCRMAPDTFLEPAVCEVMDNNGKEILVTGKSGKIYLFPPDPDYKSAGNSKATVPALLLNNDTLKQDTGYVVDTIPYLTDISEPVSFPTAVSGSIMIPCREKRIYKLSGVDSATGEITDSCSVITESEISTWICNYKDRKWAVGFINGTIGFYNDTSHINSFLLSPDSSEISALALVDTSKDILTAIDTSGKLTAFTSEDTLSSYQCRDGIPPFKIVTGDLDQSGEYELVVSDNRQGIWILTLSNNTITEYSGTDKPIDEGARYYYDSEKRDEFPENTSSPSLTDMDSDGSLDILLGSVNGVSVINANGVRLPEPSFLLDKEYWYQRKSVNSSPVTLLDSRNKPLQIFSTPTGDNATFASAKIDSTKIDSTEKDSGKIYYTLENGYHDSISGLTNTLVDSLLTYGDSVATPYVMPGGVIDARTGKGQRPDTVISQNNTGEFRVSGWPLTSGYRSETSPLLHDIDGNSKTDLISLTEDGWINRWEGEKSFIPENIVWAQTGFNSARTFAYSGPLPGGAETSSAVISHFYSYPNPATPDDELPRLKYKLSDESKVRCDIFSITGYHIYSNTGSSMPSRKGWNELIIPEELFSSMGPGVYRCRLQAETGGRKQVEFWKMAVVK